MPDYYRWTITAPADDEEAADDFAAAIVQIFCQGEGVGDEHKCRYNDWMMAYRKLDDEGNVVE